MTQDASARFCPFCGKPVAAPDTAFCASCGRALATTQQASSAAPKSAPSVPPALPANVTPSPIGYGPAAYAPAQPPMVPMSAGVHPAQLGTGVPAMSAPHSYAGMGMPPAGPVAPSVGRMIGVMLGVVGVLLVLTGVRLYINAAYLFRLLGISSSAYSLLLTVSSGTAFLVLDVPFCYWLALLRLRVVGLARLIAEVLVASFILIFARVFISDLIQLLIFRPINGNTPSFGATRSLLTGGGLVFGIFLPLVVGTLICAGAGFLVTRWNVVNRLSAKMQSRTALHFTLVLGSFVGFVCLDAFFYYLLLNLLYHSMLSLLLHGRGGGENLVFVLKAGQIVVQFIVAICVVIVASIWMRQTLRAVPAYHGAVFPSPPVSPSGAPLTSPQQEPAQQTPPTETQG